MARIFLVEDDIMVATLMKQALSKNDKFELHHFTTAEDCIANLHLRPDIVTIDYNLPGMDGLTLMDKVKIFDQNIMVIICSGQESVEVVISCYRKGAQDYILKSENMIADVETSVNNLAMNVTLRKEVELLKDQIIDRNKYSNIIGNSNAILRTLRLIQKVEKNNMMVLVTGQSGTGKELVAKALHYNSDRARKPFVIVNMGAIPNELVESELFGHEKGLRARSEL